MNLKTSLSLLFLMLAPILAPAASAPPRDTLKQLVAKLQEKPDDQDLREKIIKLVRTMQPKPAAPDEAIEQAGEAIHIFNNAKSESDYEEAAAAYKKALLLAPWNADYYYNLGTAQEKANRPQEAIASFRLYLLAAPNAKDAEEVRGRIGGLKYAAKKATKEAANKAEQERLSGRWQYEDSPGHLLLIKPGGKGFQIYPIYKKTVSIETLLFEGSLTGNNISGDYFVGHNSDCGTVDRQWSVRCNYAFEYSVPFMGNVSDDGNTLTLRYEHPAISLSVDATVAQKIMAGEPEPHTRILKRVH